MAIKAEISFKVFEGGKRVNDVRRSTLQNSWQDIQDAVFTFVHKEYPELKKSDIINTDIRLDFGLAVIEAVNNNRLFKLEANKI